MGFYNRYILPKLINCGCAASSVSKQRAKVVPLAKGDVLEIGIGTGFNLPFYDEQQVKQLWGLEPVENMLQQLEDKLQSSPLSFQVDLLESGAESIRLDDNSMDTIVMTYTLCSITQVAQAMSEMKRVLKPDGQLLFCEHGWGRTRRWSLKMAESYQSNLEKNRRRLPLESPYSRLNKRRRF